MVEFQQILNGIDGHAGKLPSIIVQCDQSPLLPFVLGVVQSRSGDVTHPSSHVHLAGIESIFIHGVPKGALILVDQSKTKVLSASRVASFPQRATPGKVSINDAEMSADKEEESAYCERGEGSRERFQLMNIHQSNDGSGQITIKALQAARERFSYPGRFIIQTPLKWLKSRFR